ncbi:MAG: GGDEF domain-containing protein [Sedimentisphaerales bacterium]|nr:GGDEF domain-containing protein [Sedimentisphaerales bacterium]MBN2844205.1 GGDEF domain-containing protein [Sedimentisphaerales bacterium]
MKIINLPDSEDEDAMFRLQDSRLAVFSILVFTFMSAMLGVADYMTLGYGSGISGLLVSKSVLILVSAGAVWYLLRSKERKYYSLLLFGWQMLYILQMIYAGLLCRENQLINTSHHLLAVIAIYVIFHNRFRLQFLPAMTITVFSLLNLYGSRSEHAGVTLFILLLTFFAMHALGIAVTLTLRKNRREYLAALTRQQQMSKVLEKMAFVDDLTGVFNRRKIMEVFELEYGRVKRYGNQLAVMMLDIDFFKHVNDKYGHDAGDCVLVEFARRVKKEIRETDFIGRFGGEEFLVLMPETDLAGAMVLAERIKKMLDESAVNIGTTTIRVTASIGISLAHNNDQAKEDSLKRADESLYMAKKAGRDRICCENEIITEKDSSYYAP